MGRVVTFYSYKGGTGRSMALADVAWVLASNGARVLVVDWDLEAPGLHRYFRPFLSDKELTRLESQGVIDLVLDYSARLVERSANTASTDDPAWFVPYADISRWSRRLLWPSGREAQTPAGGTIAFVPAGRQGPDYASKVNSFDWGQFYEHHDGGAFMEAVRASMAGYDWVLVDSRTGVSDTSGICTVQFPDVLVVCFTLNYQSIDGAAAVAGSALSARAERPLRILPLPTRLDGNEEDKLKAMMAYARRVFDPLIDPRLDSEQRDKYWREMGVPYFSRYAYAEKLAPFEEHVNVATSTLPAIERLTSYITDHTIRKLAPLPEEERAAALAEFTAVPGEVAPTLGIPVAAQAVSRVRQFAYRLMTMSYAAKALAVVVLVAVAFGSVSVLDGYRTSATSQGHLATRLIRDANVMLDESKREDAALRIAEAARRLGESAVISRQSEPGAQVYDAFLKLQPFKLSVDAPSPSDPVYRLLMSPNARQLASVGQQVSVYRLPPSGGRIDYIGYRAAAFSPDGRYLATGGRNGTCSVYDATDGRRVWQWENPDPDSAWVEAIAFSPDGNLLAIGTDRGLVVVAQVETWRTVARFEQDSEGADTVMDLQFSADSESLALIRETSVRLVSARAKEEGVKLKLAPYLPVNARPLEDGLWYFVQVTDGGSAINTLTWHPKERKQIPRTVRARGVKQLVLSPNGKQVATQSDDGVALHVLDALGSITTGGAILPPSGRLLGFSPDGRWLVAAQDDPVANRSAVQFFDTASLKHAQTIQFAGRVSTATMSADSRYLAVVAAGGTFLAFTNLSGADVQLTSTEVATFACSQAASGTFSAEDWQRYFGSEPIRYTCGARPPAPPEIAIR